MDKKVAENIIGDMNYIMAIFKGRRLMSTLLDMTEVYNLNKNTDPIAMANAVALDNMGKEILKYMFMGDQELVAQMFRERKAGMYIPKPEEGEEDGRAENDDR